MLSLRSEDTIHKSYLNRLLIEIVDSPLLSLNLAFKGGACAEMLGFLDRFSIDLDFDTLKDADESRLRSEFQKIFNHSGLSVIKEFDSVLFYQLRYPSEVSKRNTIKVSVNSIKVLANEYRVQYFPEIDRLINSQTIETMFANKLVAVTDRFNLHKTIAGRDIYDIHHFFVQGYQYNKEIIIERTGLEVNIYLKNLVEFIRKNVTQTVINEDLNSLLPPDKFQQIRKVLLPETLSILNREINRGQ